MIDFVKRLSKEQIMKFFEGIGTLEDIKPSFNEGMLDILFKKECGSPFWYSISDDFISAYGFNKSSEDWKFYLYGIFGEEYVQAIREDPVPNSFIEELSIDDVKQLLVASRIVPSSIEEKISFREGTRRFKVIIDVPMNFEMEIILGPHIDYCNGIPSLTEKMFMQFFTKKFGMNFINYYTEVEKGIEGKKIELFKEKCNQRVADKIRYMLKIHEGK